MIEVRFHGRGGQGAATCDIGFQREADRRYEELLWLSSRPEARAL
jgi:hypothetical protein